MDELRKLGLQEMFSGLLSGSFSSLELVRAHLSCVAPHDKYNAFIRITEDLAIKAAVHADKVFSNFRAGGCDVSEISNLLGVPVGVKDLFCISGVETTACSEILRGFVPGYTATVVQKLMDAGAAVMGKLNMDEFAMGSANIHSCFGPVKNPWGDVVSGGHGDIVAGGSSGGSAAAVAGFLCAASLGSDTGGSVRLPASFCGIVGFKPSYGRCSRMGMIEFASSCDQAGVLARSVSDAAIVADCVMGYDPLDGTSLDVPPGDSLYSSDGFGASVAGMRIGLLKEVRHDAIPGDVLDAWDSVANLLREAGSEVLEVSVPSIEYSLPAYYVISSSEASANLARYDGVRYGDRVEGASSFEEMCELTRSLKLGDEVKRRILMGAYVLSKDCYDALYRKAQCVRTMICRDYDSAFNEVDCVLIPTTPISAFSLNERPGDLEMYLNDMFTVSVNLAGLPAISVPVALSSNKLPLSLQVIGKRMEDFRVLSLAKFIESSIGLDLIGSLASSL